MDIKRLLLYVIWGMLALALWNAWQKDYPPKPVQTFQSTSQASTHALMAPSTPTGLIPNTAPTQTKLIEAHTDVLNLKINPQTGGLIYADLPDYPKSNEEKNTPYVLLNDQAQSYYVATSGLTNLNPLIYHADQTHYTLQPGQNSLQVKLYGEANGIAVNKTYTFKRGSYAIGVRYDLVNHGTKDWQGRFYMQTSRHFEDQKNSNLVGLKNFFGVAISSKADPYEKFTYDKLASEGITQNIQGGWLAFVQHYFLTAWVPNKNQTYLYQSQVSKDQMVSVTLMGEPLSAAHQQAIHTQANFYVGPAIKSNLDALAPHLSLTIDYGWLWMISMVLFVVMKAIHTFVGNWGLSIIILTILIKLLFYKLSEKSYRSMAHMRDLQPKLTALKEQLKDDKQALGKATMALYRQEKVNPMGGCLPQIVQIPVFIGLYYLLAESVQLRMAHFLWIHDLSLKDPYYILPILMGVSMFIQQRLSPPPGDPTQAKVMMFLPVFFIIIFLNFPAGLTLYWLTNSTISVLQQWYVMRKFKRGDYQKKKKKRARPSAKK